jgi:putative oxidoreductase
MHPRIFGPEEPKPMKSFNRALATGTPYAPVVMRLILGAYLFWRGYTKFNSATIDGVEAFFTAEGVPLAGIAAPAVAVAEIVVGLALILGIGTRIAALVQILILVGALIFVKFTPAGEPAEHLIARSEIDFVYIAGLLGVMLLGPGQYSVDDAINAEDTVIDLRTKSGEKITAGV